MTEKIKKWWDEHSSEFQREYSVPVDINYGPGSPNENSLNLLGDVRGKDVLEIGCGGAQCGVAFAKKGAHVTGMDVSEEQLKFARNLAQKNKVNIRFYQGDVENLGRIKSESQDIVFSSWALLYVKDLRKCFKEVYRVLRPKGVFVFSMDHPFWISIDKHTLKLKRSYFETGLYKDSMYSSDWFGYHYKIGDLIDFIVSSGLTLEKVIEPDSRKDYKEDSWRERYGEHRINTMKFIPRTIIFKSRKLS